MTASQHFGKCCTPVSRPLLLVHRTDQVTSAGIFSVLPKHMPNSDFNFENRSRSFMSGFYRR